MPEENSSNPSSSVPPVDFLLFITSKILFGPIGRYAISFDSLKKRVEDRLPGESATSWIRTLRRVNRSLCASGFQQQRDNFYVSERRVLSAFAYFVMTSLCDEEPTLQNVKLHHIPNPVVIDVTSDLQLGGFFSPHLEGPTPRALVERIDAERAEQGLPAIPAEPVPAATFVRPADTEDTPEANDPANWVQHPQGLES